VKEMNFTYFAPPNKIMLMQFRETNLAKRQINYNCVGPLPGATQYLCNPTERTLKYGFKNVLGYD
jgi:hypothetical protein